MKKNSHRSLYVLLTAGQVSPKLAIRSTPPAHQPMRKQRRHHYDDITVLSNRYRPYLLSKRGNCLFSNFYYWLNLGACIFQVYEPANE